MNLANLLMRTAAALPERPALAMGDRDLFDYRELARRAGALARSLRESVGLKANDRVALFMRNCPEYLEILYGLWSAGLVAVPINNKLHAKEAAYIVEDSEARAVFATEDLAGDIAAAIGGLPAAPRLVVAGSADYAGLLDASPLAPVDRAPDDLAWLFYTSGTTGKPKGVMLTGRNLLTMSLCYFTDVDAAGMEDSILYAAPMSHGAGMYNFAHVLVGARHLVPASGGFEAAEIFDLSRRYGNLSMFAAPTMVRRLVDHCAAGGADPSGIKTVVYGGGPMYLEDIRRGLEVMGNRFVQIYGQGESPMTITALSRYHMANRDHPRYLERLASVGLAQSAVEVRVADSDGNPLLAGETGEVIVRGDTVMRGYWRNPEATARTVRDGWLYTGDVGALDEDGFLTLKDRSRDVIISGGSNIYPREVEEVLLKHPAVREVSVVGRKDSEWGEVVVAFVVAEGVTAAEMDALCLEHIARFKRPKEYRFVESLPKNNYGKVLKTVLRDMQ
ncbi:MAG: AMP-dependent synthetase [Rhodocyclaceae bacterium]|nr:AMP-dependent synthetase [Rhodocyclaceae bacterium]